MCTLSKSFMDWIYVVYEQFFVFFVDSVRIDFGLENRQNNLRRVLVDPSLELSFGHRYCFSFVFPIQVPVPDLAGSSFFVRLCIHVYGLSSSSLYSVKLLNVESW